MSNFLICFIINIFSILFKVSSQNQNNILLNIPKELENILNIINNYTQLANYTVEEKNLIIKVENGLFNNHRKYIYSLINIYNKNISIINYITLLSNKNNGYPEIFKNIHSFLHYHHEAMELFLNLTYDYPEILDLLKLLKNKKIIDYYLYLLKDKGFLEVIPPTNKNEVIPFLAVGGIGPDNVADFMKAGCVGAGVGGNLTNKEWIAAGAWGKIEDVARQLVERSRT